MLKNCCTANILEVKLILKNKLGASIEFKYIFEY